MGGKFDVFLTNRDSSYKIKGGGSAILIDSRLKSKIVKSISIMGNDIIICDLIHQSQVIRLICLYRPPNSPFCSTKKLIRILKDYHHENTILCGDFNAPFISHVSRTIRNHTDLLLLDYFSDLGFSQLINEPTHEKGAILDLLLANKNSLISHASVQDGLSDHFSIQFQINIPKPTASIKCIPDMSDTNLKKIMPSFSHISPISLKNEPTINGKYNLFIENIHFILDTSLPMLKISNRPKAKNYPKHIKKALSQKRKTFLLFKKSKASLKEYQNICKTVKHLLKKYNRNFISNLVTNSKKLYKFVNSKKMAHQNIPTIIHNNIVYSDNSSKCEIFADIFQKNFMNNPLHSPPSLNLPKIQDIIEDIKLDIPLVSYFLSKAPNKNSTSPDGIPYKLLKHCRLSLAPTITEIFRVSLYSSTLPAFWKQSIVIPIFKNGDKSQPANYRPISLTSTLCRILERIIALNILKFLTKNKLINPEQFGFLPHRSTTAQLLSATNSWYNSLLKDIPSHCLYVDLHKAFDSVPHKFLIFKLHAYGIRGKLLSWIKNFLTDRTFRVKIEDKVSPPKLIKSGVPQGSVLGPLLFLIYINDLPLIIPHPIQIRMYADDIKLFHHILSIMDARLLQKSLNAISKWCADWALPIAKNKTFLFKIGSNIEYPYTINDTSIDSISSIRDLGVLMDSSLSFKEHISIIVRNAYFRSYQLLRTIHSSDPKIWAIAFTTYVRPILEYSSEIWNPRLNNLKEKIEKVQRFYSRRALYKCKQYDINSPKPYHERLKILNLDTLELRRKITDLCMIFKIINGLVHLDKNSFLEINTRTSRKNNFQIKFPKKNSKTENSLINRSINLWNSLPPPIFLAESSENFKARLRDHLTNSPRPI